MKKFTSLMAVALFAVSASFGQATDPDLGVTELENLYFQMPVYPNVNLNVDYTIHNHGTRTVNSSEFDTLQRRLYLRQGATAIEVMPRGFIRFAQGKNSIDAGETVRGRNTTVTIDFSSYTALTAGNLDICVSSNIRKGGTNIDVDQSNDEACQTVTYTGASTPLTYDWQIHTPRLVNASASDSVWDENNDVVSNEESWQFVSWFMYNNGITNIERFMPFVLELSFNGTSEGLFQTTTNIPLGPGSTISRAIDLFDNSLFVPFAEDNNGQLEVCIELQDQYDTDNSNDKACATFNSLVDVEELEDAELPEITITYFNRNLNVVLGATSNGAASIDVISINGQVAGSYNVDGNVLSHDIDLNNLNSGIYIVNVKTADNLVQTERIIVE